MMASTGCKKEFLDRYPLDQITDNTFWKSANDLELYVNSFYSQYITGFSESWADGTLQPYGYNVAAIAYGDVISDNAAPQLVFKGERESIQRTSHRCQRKWRMEFFPISAH